MKRFAITAGILLAVLFALFILRFGALGAPKDQRSTEEVASPQVSTSLTKTSMDLDSLRPGQSVRISSTKQELRQQPPQQKQATPNTPEEWRAYYDALRTKNENIIVGGTGALPWWKDPQMVELVRQRAEADYEDSRKTCEEYWQGLTWGEDPWTKAFVRGFGNSEARGWEVRDPYEWMDVVGDNVTLVMKVLGGTENLRRKWGKMPVANGTISREELLTHGLEAPPEYLLQVLGGNLNRSDFPADLLAKADAARRRALHEMALERRLRIWPAECAARQACAELGLPPSAQSQWNPYWDAIQQEKRAILDSYFSELESLL